MMLNFEKNTAEAVTRIYALALMVEGKVNEARLRWIQRRVENQGLSLHDVLRLVRDYEQCAMDMGKRTPRFFLSNERLPQFLVHACFNEIDGDVMRLRMAKELYGLLNTGGNATLKERLFLEAAVGYWGINNLWHRWLLGHAEKSDLGVAA
ncbi:MAG: hypothetical protein QGI45_10030 [Myxococcota bacterium]|jgi:hypothetical protein|nr:hypothetical protein [Myxococcota bacterium]